MALPPSLHSERMAASPPRSSSDVAAARLHEILRSGASGRGAEPAQGAEAADTGHEAADLRLAAADSVLESAGDVHEQEALDQGAPDDDDDQPRYRFGLWSVPASAFVGAAVIAVTAVLGLVVYTVTQAPDQQAVPQRTTPQRAVSQQASPSAAGTGSAVAAGLAADVRSAGSAASATSSTTSTFLVVHVAGQVTTPGIVQVAPGSRVADAVQAAGGVLPEADLDRLNLARVVVDGEQVLIPAPGQSMPPSGSGGTPSGAGGASSAGGGSGSAPPAGSGPPELINVNTAAAAELEELPGIGPVLAQRIVEYRDSTGGLRSVEELVEVPGIGDKVLSRLRPRATV